MTEHFGPWSVHVLDEALDQGSLENAVLDQVVLTGRDISRQNWSDIRIRGAECGNADFLDVTWKHVVSDMSNFRKTLFAGSYFEEVDFSTCNLGGCDFSDAQFTRCRINDSLLPHVNLHHTKAHGCHFRNFEAPYARISQAVFVDCVFECLDVSGITGFRDGRMWDGLFLRCSFLGECLERVDLSGSVFISCDFKNVSWEGCTWAEARFVDCQSAPGHFIGHEHMSATDITMVQAEVQKMRGLLYE